MPAAPRLAGLALLALAAVTRADDASPAPDQPYPIRLRVGESVSLCATGTLLCPAAGVRCDDQSIAVAEMNAGGPFLRGASPGVTLCSAASASGAGPRRVYRVTVAAAQGG